MDSWEEHDAKTHFSKLLGRTLKSGPQLITRLGIPVAVLSPIDEWKRLQQAARPGLKKLLMAPPGQTKELTPERRSLRRRSSAK